MKKLKKLNLGKGTITVLTENEKNSLKGGATGGACDETASIDGCPCNTLQLTCDFCTYGTCTNDGNCDTNEGGQNCTTSQINYCCNTFTCY